MDFYRHDHPHHHHHHSNPHHHHHHHHTKHYGLAPIHYMQPNYEPMPVWGPARTVGFPGFSLIVVLFILLIIIGTGVCCSTAAK